MIFEEKNEIYNMVDNNPFYVIFKSILINISNRNKKKESFKLLINIFCELNTNIVIYQNIIKNQIIEMNEKCNEINKLNNINNELLIKIKQKEKQIDTLKINNNKNKLDKDLLSVEIFNLKKNIKKNYYNNLENKINDLLNIKKINIIKLFKKIELTNDNIEKYNLNKYINELMENIYDDEIQIVQLKYLNH